MVEDLNLNSNMELLADLLGICSGANDRCMCIASLKLYPGKLK